jgi:CRISPR/Cas system-associated exonuclease Cas4 (RecB family)
MIRQGTNILKEHSNQRLDFNPQLKQINFLDRRVYKRSEGVFYPSVTTILQYMPRNQFFENWLKDVGHNADLIASKAAKQGTQVHEAAEALVKGEEVSWMDDYGKAKYSQLVWEMILRFYEFWTTHKPELISTEEFVFSDKFEYAGTADLLVKMDNETWLLDIKTSKHMHKVYHLQLAAYAKAIEETKGIKVDRTGIVWLKSHTKTISNKKGVYQGKGWQIKIIDSIDKNFDLFKQIYNFYKLDHPTTEPIYNSYPTTLKL